MDSAGLAALLAGAQTAPRVSFAVENLASGAALPAAIVPMALNAALLAAEALPHGGTVRLDGDDVQGLAVWPDGRSAAWPQGTLAVLAGAATEGLEEDGPRRVLAPLVLALAAEAGWSVSVGVGPPGSGAAPLLLAPT